MPDDASHVIALFTDFLDAFGQATPAERRAFLDFISPQSRDDLIHLADALREKAATEERLKGEIS
jgi:hypothetical protein